MIKIYNLGELDKAVAGFLEATKKLYRRKFETMMRKIITLIQSDIADHFDKARGPSGKWNPLKNPRPGSSSIGKPLQDTGALRRAATSSQAPGNITRINGTTIVMGVNKVQGSLMNDGGIVKPKNVKFLAAPATLEAKRVGSPRRFPRKLTAIINKKGTGGVLVEYKKSKKKKGKKGGKAAPKDKIVQYYLFKEAIIPPRPYMWISDKCMGYIDKLAVKTFKEILKEHADQENH